MIRRGTKIALEVVLALMALTLVVTGVLMWRLSQGPVELDFLTPRLESALTQAREGVEVTVGGTVLAWEGWPETVALRLTDVAVAGDGGTRARIPALDLKLSFPALVAGTLAPTEVTARGARLSVTRGPAGFRFGAPGDTEAAETPSDVSELLPEVLADLMAAPRPQRRLSYLETVRIADARLRVRDEILGAVWRAQPANIMLQREPFGIAGSADLRMRLGGETVSASATLQYRQADARIGILANVRNLKPSALAAKAPALADASGITVPLSGTLGVSFGLAGRVGDVSADLRGGEGQIAWPDRLPEPVPVRSLTARVRLDRSTDELTLPRFEVDFGTPERPGPRISVSARASGLSGDSRIAGEGRVTNLAVDELELYWPKGVGGNARPWVTENIKTGTAEVNEMRFDVTLPDGDPDRAELVEFGGRLLYENLDVHYLRPMPPVTDVRGAATFDADSLNLEVASGRLDDLQVPRAQIDITGLDTTDHRIAIDLDVRGPLRTALTTLDHPRLDLMGPLGIEPGRTSGDADVNATFRFPLIAELTMDEVAVEASARLERVNAENFLLGQDASGGAFDLYVDKSHMELDGPVNLGGLPLDLEWQENFDEDATYRSEIEARIPRIGPDDLTRFGMDTRPYLDGPVAANVRARTDAAGSGFVKMAVNLNDAALALPPLNWRKPPGGAGEAQFDLRLQEGRPTGLRRFSVVAGGDSVPRLDVHGSIDLGGKNTNLERVALDTLSLGRTRLNKLTVRRDGERWMVAVANGTLDAEPLLAALDGGAETPADGDAAPPGPPLEIRDTTLSRLRLAEGRYLSDVELAAERGPEGWWRRLHLEASIPEQFGRPGDGDKGGRGTLFLDYAPRPDGRRAVKITASDTGAALRALDVFDTLEGGRLNIEGLSRGADPASAIDATIDLRDFKIVKAPALAKLLTVASLTGISDLLQGKGIGFQRFSGGVILDDGVLSTEFVHAYGPALGITAKGSVDIKGDSSDLRGTVVPAASVNRVLGKIPVLGTLLTGGEGGGVFAATYTLTGPLQDPDINVNPLSMLAPGFLRNLFDVQAGSETAPTRPPRALPEQSGK